MRKMSTLFIVEYDNNKGTIKPEVRPENLWVFNEGTTASVKFDGTACMVRDGLIYKRYDAKRGKAAPEGAIPCQTHPDPITRHHPHWVKCVRDNPADKYFFEAFDLQDAWGDATYELCGEKVGINAEGVSGHKLLKHGSEPASGFELTFVGIRAWLEVHDVEGIVFRSIDNKRCKIRKTDFGFKRGE